MKLLGMFSRSHQPNVEALSALEDRRLSAGDAAAMRKHLTSCEACRTRLDELRQVRSALTALPRAETTRSFRLRPSDVREQAPARTASSAAGAMRAMPALAGVAAVLLVAVIAVDATSRSGSASRSSGDSYQASAPRESDAPISNGVAEDSSGSPSGPQGDSAGEKTADDAGAGAAAPQPRAPEAATAFDTLQLSPTPAPALRAAEPTAAPPSPEAARASDQVSDDGDDSRTAWRIAEAALGAIAAGAAGIAIFSWRARQR